MRFTRLLPRTPRVHPPTLTAASTLIRVGGGILVATLGLIVGETFTGVPFAPTASALAAQEPGSAEGDERDKAAVPSETLRSSQESQDGPKEAEQALAAARELLDSNEPADWVRGLFQLEQALSDGKISADDWRRILLDYLDTRGAENLDRTRAMLNDRVLRTPAGERVLLELLGGGEAYDTFRRELEEAITRIATERERRDALAERLDEMPGQLFERLFPLLAHHEPGRMVSRAVELYQGDPSGSLAESILGALARFLGQEFPTEAVLLEWWEKHQKDPILPLLIEQQRVDANARTALLWTRANNLIAEGDPAKHRNWLLDSLAVSETAEVRRKALQEIERFVARISSGDVAQPAETQLEILRPILQRLPPIISGEATQTLDRDPIATRLLAVKALRSMSIFREDKDVIALLELLIGNLADKGFVGESPDVRIGLAAIRAAGAMRAPVGETLDRTFATLLRPTPEAKVAWSKIPAKPLSALLDALKQVGVRAETMTSLEEVYENLPASQVDVLEVLVLRGVPKASEPQALALFAKALAPQASNPEPNENLQKLAINGFGRLGLPGGIPILEEGIRNAVITGDERSRALQSIRTIGGIAALESMMTLLASVPEGDPLREELVRSSAELCVADSTLESLEFFLLDPETGAKRSWFGLVTARPELAPLLDPGKQPADFQEANPAAFGRFERIHALRARDRLEKALAGETLPKIAEQLGIVAGESAPLLELLGRFPVGDAPLDRSVLQAAELTATHRQRLVVQMIENNPQKLISQLELALTAEATLFPEGAPEGVPWVGNHVSWLVSQVSGFSPFSDEVAFLAGLERLSERYPMGEEVRAQLAELEARSATNGAGAGTTGTDGAGNGDTGNGDSGSGDTGNGGSDAGGSDTGGSNPGSADDRDDPPGDGS